MIVALKFRYYIIQIETTSHLTVNRLPLFLKFGINEHPTGGNKMRGYFKAWSIIILCFFGMGLLGGVGALSAEKPADDAQAFPRYCWPINFMS